jgi:hypothetical protein
MTQAVVLAILFALAAFIAVRIVGAMISLVWKLFLIGLVFVTLLAAGGVSWWLVTA